MINERVREFIEENYSGCFVLNHEKVINEEKVIELINDADAVIRTIVDDALVIYKSGICNVIEYI